MQSRFQFGLVDLESAGSIFLPWLPSTSQPCRPIMQILSDLREATL